MNTTWSKTIVASTVAATAVAFATTAVAQSETVYQNTTTPLNAAYQPGSGVEFGNELTLGGTTMPAGGTIQDFTFQYSGAAATADFRIYQNDGAQLAGGTTIATMQPHTVLFDSGSFSLAASATPAGITISSINVAVPSTFTWTLTFTGAGATGLSLYGPPTIGDSYNTIWVNNGSGWVLSQAGGNYSTFGALITGTPAAVPEPTTLAMGALGLLAVGGMMRARRNQA